MPETLWGQRRRAGNGTVVSLKRLTSMLSGEVAHLLVHSRLSLLVLLLLLIEIRGVEIASSLLVVPWRWSRWRSPLAWRRARGSTVLARWGTLRRTIVIVALLVVTLLALVVVVRSALVGAWKHG